MKALAEICTIHLCVFWDSFAPLGDLKFLIYFSKLCQILLKVAEMLLDVAQLLPEFHIFSFHICFQKISKCNDFLNLELRKFAEHFNSLLLSVPMSTFSYHSLQTDPQTDSIRIQFQSRFLENFRKSLCAAFNASSIGQWQSFSLCRCSPSPFKSVPLRFILCDGAFSAAALRPSM